VTRGWAEDVIAFVLLASLEAGNLRVEVPLPDLLLEVDDDVHGYVHDAQLGLRLVRLEVGHADHAELLQGLVNVADPDPLPSIVG